MAYSKVKLHYECNPTSQQGSDRDTRCLIRGYMTYNAYNVKYSKKEPEKC
jgi:hypothetical protein